MSDPIQACFSLLMAAGAAGRSCYEVITFSVFDPVSAYIFLLLPVSLSVCSTLFLDLFRLSLFLSFLHFSFQSLCFIFRLLIVTSLFICHFSLFLILSFLFSCMFISSALSYSLSTSP